MDGPESDALYIEDDSLYKGQLPTNAVSRENRKYEQEAELRLTNTTNIERKLSEKADGELGEQSADADIGAVAIEFTYLEDTES